jgi:predicted metal-dependent hydrolase
MKQLSFFDRFMGLVLASKDASPASIPYDPHTPLTTETTAWIHPQAHRIICLENRYLAFRFTRASRRSLGFIVKPQGLEVRAPHRMSWNEIDRGLHHQAPWIWKKHAEQCARLQTGTPHAPWVMTSTQAGAQEGFLTLLGRRVVWYEVPFGLASTRPSSDIAWVRCQSPKKRGLVMACDLGAGEGGSHAVTKTQTPPPITWAQCWALLAQTDPLLVLQVAPSPALRTSTSHVDQTDCIRGLVHAWLEQATGHFLESRLNLWAGQIGVKPRAWSLTRAQTRWGSATSQGHIRLHASLIHLPLEIVDYVVVHELAHLLEMNHSPRFWAVVERVMPDYSRRQRALKAHRPQHA